MSSVATAMVKSEVQCTHKGYFTKRFFEKLIKDASRIHCETVWVILATISYQGKLNGLRGLSVHANGNLFHNSSDQMLKDFI